MKCECALMHAALHLCVMVSYHCLFFSVDTKVSVIDGSSPFASAYDLDNIIGSYQDRNCKLEKALIFVPVLLLLPTLYLKADSSQAL